MLPIPAHLLLAAALPGAASQDVTHAVQPTWQAEVLLERPEGVRACTVADLDPSHEGSEIVLVTESGQVLVVLRDGGAWRAVTAARMPGELLGCAVGDVDPRRPGEELLVFGRERGRGREGAGGAAFLVYPPRPRGWSAARLFLADAPLTRGLVADFDPGHEGPDVALAGGGRVIRLFRDGSRWGTETLAEPGGPVRGLEAFGEGLALGTDEALVRLVRDAAAATGWSPTDLADGPGGPLAASSGTTLLVGTPTGRVRLLAPDSSEDVLGPGSGIRSLCLADLVPESPGDEAAVLSEEGGLRVAWRAKGGWSTRTPVPASADLRHVAAGELAASRPGAELALVSGTGELWLVYRTDRAGDR